MRQLKNTKTKETRKEKQERRKENQKIKSQFASIVLPSLFVIAALIVAYVYALTRPKY